MNLLELQKAYNEKQMFIKIQITRLNMIKSKIENISSSSVKEINISGGPKRTDLLDLINEKIKIENDINFMYKEIDAIIPIIRDLEKIFAKLGERDKQIYIQRKIWC